MRAHPASLFEISTQEWGCEPGLSLCPPCWNVELLLMVEVAGVGAAPMAPRQHPSHQAPWLCLQPLPQNCLHPHPQLVCGKAATSILQLLGAGKSPEGVPAPGTARALRNSPDLPELGSAPSVPKVWPRPPTAVQVPLCSKPPWMGFEPSCLWKTLAKGSADISSEKLFLGPHKVEKCHWGEP